MYERERDTDIDAWFSVKATDPYTRKEWGGGREGAECTYITLQHYLRFENEKTRDRER